MLVSERDAESRGILPHPVIPSSIVHGQGRSVTTLLPPYGGCYPIILHESYHDNQRSQTAPFKTGRGSRPMHQTTLTISKPPWMQQDAYETSVQQNFSGKRILEPILRPSLCPSMHHSQIIIGNPGNDTRTDNYVTHYQGIYHEKAIVPANRLHLISMKHKLNHGESSDIKESFHKRMETPGQMYRSHYGRYHDHLGYLRGAGVRREYPIREQYDVLTGELKGDAWKEDNRKISGARIMHRQRLAPENQYILN